MTHRSKDALLDLMTAKTVVDLGEVREALGNASRATAFRWLAQIPHISSYNHNGRFYALDLPDRFDRFGLFHHGDVRFCRDATLAAAVVRLVQETEAGQTQRELQDLLRVRVQPFLLAGVRRGAISRQLFDRLFLYLHADGEVQQAQLTRRQALIASAAQQLEVPDAVVIEVLLLLLHQPGAAFADVVRRLGRRSPPISSAQVGAVFSRYDLDHIGAKKGGP
ncbi:MAG: hypothetical protein FJ125_00070 [Deltaproteobacteria bacterium]|nr:hypothetical protein [Deltaproteobacteria bacterium]